MIAFAPQFQPEDHADFSANSFGVIGDSADKRYTFCRTDFGLDGPRPKFIYVVDWHAMPNPFAPLESQK